MSITFENSYKVKDISGRSPAQAENGTKLQTVCLSTGAVSKANYPTLNTRNLPCPSANKRYRKALSAFMD